MAQSFSFRHRLRLAPLLILAGLAVWQAGGNAAPAAGAVSPRPTQFPAAAEIPPGIREALLDGCRKVAGAATLDALTTARDTLDRLRERQREAGRTWLVAADEVAFALGDLLTTRRDPSPSVSLPLDLVLARLHWRLAAASSAALGEDVSVAFDTTPGGAVVAARLAAGDRAAERGWQTAAVAAWREAETVAQWMQAPALAQQAADRQAAWSALQMPKAPISTAPPPAAPPVAAQLLWRHRLPTDERLKNARDHAAVELTLSAAGVTATGSLVCWHTSGGIHARRLSDGGVPWRDAAGGPVSDRLFPPAGDTPIAAPTWAPCLAGGRLLSVIAPQGGTARPVSSETRPPLLVCLDITDATQGRLEWSTPLPVSVTDAVGQPVCGHADHGEGLAFLCLRGDTNELLAVRLADGQLLWRRPLSLARRNAPRGGPHDSDHSPSPPTPILAEDLVLVAMPDGCVWAVDFAGNLVWVQTQASQQASAPTNVGSRETLLDAVTLKGLGEAIKLDTEPAGGLAIVTDHSKVVVCDGVSIRVFELLETD